MQIKWTLFINFDLLLTALCESDIYICENWKISITSQFIDLNACIIPTFHHFYFIDMRNDLLIIIQSYSKYDTYGKEKNYRPKCIAKPRSKQNTAFVYICKKIIRTFKFFFLFLYYFFFFLRESIILILFLCMSHIS